MAGLVVVFAKPPLPGVAKTRLGRELGLEAAARVAGALLADTCEALARAGFSCRVATTDPSIDHGVDPPLWDQGDGPLGGRIERMLRRGLAEADWVAAVGADAPHVGLAAWEALRSAPGPALGPTEDGGFWALRLASCPAGLLDGIPWSAATTGEATRARLTAWGMPPTALPLAWDVDTAPDLRRLLREGGAPRTDQVAREVLP